MRSPGLAALVCDAVFCAHEARLFLADRLGNAAWSVDVAAGTVDFAGPRPARFGMQVIGSAAPGPRSWLWAWANPSGFGPHVLGAAQAARSTGARYGIPELTAAELSFDPDEPGREPGLQPAYDLALAVHAVTRSWFGYSGQVPGGTRVWLVLDGLALPPPSLPRTLRVLSEALTTTTVTDHRRAVTSYAALRGAPWDGTFLRLPDGVVHVVFDQYGRLANLSGTTGR